jgi:hypothetical protein
VDEVKNQNDPLDELRREVATLRREVAALRSERWQDEPRLGPRDETPEEVAARTRRIVAALDEAIAKVDANKKESERLVKDINEQNDKISTVTEKIKAMTRDAPPVDRTKLDTTSGEPPEKVRAEQTEPTGQHKAYVVLSAEECARGFVRPYRDKYKHVGAPGPKYPLRDLDDEAVARYADFSYVKFEGYPSGSPETREGSVTGRFWTQPQLDAIDKGCGTVTSMGRTLSETYARDPKFYSHTFCVHCNKHPPVEEFVWTADGERVGS